MTEFARILVPRLQRTHLSGILRELFSNLDVATLQDLQARLEWRHFAGGEIVFQQNQPGEAMVIVINGRLKMLKKDAQGREQSLGEFRRGSYLGGYVLLTGEPYRESVVAVRDTDAVLLSQAVFQDLLPRYPEAVLSIARKFVQQQLSIQSVSREASREVSLALVPCSPGVPLSHFAQRLAQIFNGLGCTLHLSSQRFDDLYGKPDASQTASSDPINPSIVAWLSDREVSCNYLLYEADPAWTPWTRRCLRQADRIVLVTQANGDPTPGEIELAMQSPPLKVRQELVLLWPERVEQPVGTSKWLTLRQVHRHHHVKLDSQSDLQRLARLLIGRPNGLVLSGGAARGSAHIGVYRALLDAGIAIDVIGGTSMGALVAAAINYYPSTEDQDRLAQRYFSKKMLHDSTLPISSLMATRKVTHVMQTLFGDVQIEDLWRPFFCISSNLTRSEQVVHRSGDLWKAVRASIAIPGVFSPLCMDGDILVDGGVMNNLPVDVMREDCEGGTVIAVNVNPAKEGHRPWDFGPSISGWQVLWSRLNPFAKRMRVPTLFETVTRATVMNSRNRLRSMLDQADILIEPDTSQFASMDWSAYEQIAEQGYQAARTQIAAWQSRLIS
jgi:predicted acylesterase/phospholipase RssA/CRP-like cAMP-binding protein